MEVQLLLTPISGTASGTLDITMTEETGLYFSSIFFGDPPEVITYSVLSGTSTSFTAVQFQPDATFSGGSMVIGSSGPGGVLQVVDLEEKELLSIYETPVLHEDDVEDFS